MTLQKSGCPKVLAAADLSPAQSVLKPSLRRQRTQRMYPETGTGKHNNDDKTANRKAVQWTLMYEKW